jgi:hypothetical protein
MNLRASFGRGRKKKLKNRPVASVREKQNKTPIEIDRKKKVSGGSQKGNTRMKETRALWRKKNVSYY